MKGQKIHYKDIHKSILFWGCLQVLQKSPAAMEATAEAQVALSESTKKHEE
jgi:hypothetical protein